MCACSTNLGFSVEKNVLVLVWKKYLGSSAGYQRAPGTSEKKKNAWYQRALRYQLRGRPFHPWAGRPRFSGAATLTQSSSFSCRAGLQSESRLLLCCAPAVYMLAADAAVAAAVFGLDRLISYCNHTKQCFGPTSRGQGRRLFHAMPNHCLLYTSPSPRDQRGSRMPSSA